MGCTVVNGARLSPKQSELHLRSVAASAPSEASRDLHLADATTDARPVPAGRPARRSWHETIRRDGRAARFAALAAAWMTCGVACSDRTLVAVGPSTLRNGLIGLWHFDEVTGSMAADSSGNGNDGTLTGFTDLSSVWVPGRLGNALAVEGRGYVLVPHTTSIDGIKTGVTVAAWVYWEGPITDYGTAISRQIGTGIDQYYHLALRGTGGYPDIFISPSDAPRTPYTAAKAAPRNTWIHMAGTYDGVTATLYVNGENVLAEQVSGEFPADPNPLILAGNMNNMNVILEQFPGKLDEIALYDRGLTPAEIEQLSQAVVF